MSDRSSTVELACELISRASVTPNDAGCQDLIARRLEPLGFTIEKLRYGDVDNTWARKGTAGPLFAFAGHTDVVPPGPPEHWRTNPFSPHIENGFIYGRGAADMKGSLAAMVTAVERFVAANPAHNGSIAFLLTSDEEGAAVNGTVSVVEHLMQRGVTIDFCIVGEPTSTATLGDTIKNGRRGSLSGNLQVHGKQGHVAYPHLAENPVHLAAPVIMELCEREWDRGTEYFSPTTFQISNLHAGTGADNVIPGDLEVDFNFRYSPALDAEELKAAVEAIVRNHGLDYSLAWRHSGKPFITPKGTLVEAASEAVRQVAGTEAELSTSGGTSDARFIAPTGAQVIELGPLNTTIHQVNECVSTDDLERLSFIYEETLRSLLL